MNLHDSLYRNTGQWWQCLNKTWQLSALLLWSPLIGHLVRYWALIGWNCLSSLISRQPSDWWLTAVVLYWPHPALSGGATFVKWSPFKILNKTIGPLSIDQEWIFIWFYRCYMVQFAISDLINFTEVGQFIHYLFITLYGPRE